MPQTALTITPKCWAGIPAGSSWSEIFFRMTVSARPGGHGHCSSTPKCYPRGYPPNAWVINLAAAVCGKESVNCKRILHFTPLTRAKPLGIERIETCYTCRCGGLPLRLYWRVTKNAMLRYGSMAFVKTPGSLIFKNVMRALKGSRDQATHSLRGKLPHRLSISKVSFAFIKINCGFYMKK